MDVSGKRLLIIGAGRGQIGLYKAAKEMGIHTIAGTMLDNTPPGIKLADEVCYMDIANPDEVLEKSKLLNLDGIATCCLDTGIPALGKVCDTLNLTGLTESAAIMCGDKLKMKRAFMKCGVSTARFSEISNEKELEVALKELQLPVIIKATDLQGSNGIYISKTYEAAFRGFKEAMRQTKRTYVIVEEYIEGWEFGAQSFVYNGEVLFIMPHGDETYMSDTAVPIGHYVPLECSESIYRQTETAVKKAIEALGLNNCAINVDLILKDNKVYVIELTGRVGANCLPELVQINYGIEYYKMIAAMALGENPCELWKRKRAVARAGLARMLFRISGSGILEDISYDGEIEDNICDISFFKKTGDEIREFRNSNDCIGQIIVQGKTLECCNQLLQEIINHVNVKIKK